MPLAIGFNGADKAFGRDASRLLETVRRGFYKFFQKKGFEPTEGEGRLVAYVFGAREGYVAFVKKLAQLLGRKPALTAFNAGELEALQTFHTRHPSLTQTMLVEAFERAPQKTLPYLFREIQRLANRKET